MNRIAKAILLAILAVALACLFSDRRPAQRRGRPTVAAHEHVLTQSLAPGLNAVSLPCAREEVDLETLAITCSKAPGDVRILGLVVPRERSLYWRVFSPVSGEAQFRVTFLRRNRP